MTISQKQKSLSYEDAGVNIAAGDALVQRIKNLAKGTKRPEVLASIGGYSALFELPNGKYQHPVLVSATDGVGTKLKLATALKKHDTIGIDLVAMCVNDIVVCGAEPLFFLDYFATGHLEVMQAESVIAGIATGCKLAGVSLIGGETAEMPGFYQQEDYDLAGFCVGVVEKDRIIDGTHIKAGNVLLGLASSGPHSNGFSLIRKILELTQTDLNTQIDDTTLGSCLLEPTRIYVKALLELQRAHTLLGVAHITGGGFTENLPRILPKDLQAVLYTQSWEWPLIFRWLQAQGQIATDEMHRTFNCGVGMVLCVHEDEANAILDCLKQLGETAWIIGEVRARGMDASSVIFC